MADDQVFKMKMSTDIRAAVACTNDDCTVPGCPIHDPEETSP